MVSVDEHTQVAMEVVAQTLKISEQTLLRLLEALSKLLESKEKKPKDYILDDKTKAGKQKISDLINKHEKNGGVVALDENLTKQQLNDYQKELKKLGVDFSVVRNGKEDYSFFFSAAQANVIEKALKNVVERKIAVLDKEEVKKAEKDLKEVRQDLTTEQAEKVKEVYDEITTAEKKEPKENNINYDRLSKQEKLLYAKLEELDEIKRGLYSQEVDRVENLFANRYKQDVEKEAKLMEKDTNKEKESKKEKTEVETNSKENKDQVNNMLNSLNNEEQKLMVQYTKVMSEDLDNHYADKSSYIESNKFDEMKKNFTPEQIEKVDAVVEKNISSFGKKDGKIDINDFQGILNDIKQERAKEKTEVKTDPKDQVKNMLNSLNNKEQELMVQYTKVLSEGLDNHFADRRTYTESNKFKDMKSNFTPEQIEKVTTIVNKNIDSGTTPTKNGKIHVDKFQNILNDLKKERSKEKIKEEPKQKKDPFSMDGVKALDKKIKEEQKEIAKDKNKKQTISR
ncbi:DUF3801 domain-containing protein [Bacillus pseudomycoides]|uniref:DUF3801 domain-containing protein n=1 Tax=Bacillus pseudomycoides TaxID=64104 RepID=UPI000BF58209|nr:DUF3801 domain-containing protein [Bacillus pseudomycoides]PFW93873.1 DUF3801 domain-containing protein [Bacillus pseudomycoides]PFX37580.1 DUF3801 domain-containing protein [Bacillus pseudomycoides]